MGPVVQSPHHRRCRASPKLRGGRISQCEACQRWKGSAQPPHARRPHPRVPTVRGRTLYAMSSQRPKKCAHREVPTGTFTGPRCQTPPLPLPHAPRATETCPWDLFCSSPPQLRPASVRHPTQHPLHAVQGAFGFGAVADAPTLALVVSCACTPTLGPTRLPLCTATPHRPPVLTVAMRL